MKRIELFHKEDNEQCMEILKSIIAEDEVLKIFHIDRNTLLQNLPEKIVNEFLDFLNKQGKHREWMLKMIKEGKVTVRCWEEEEPRSNGFTNNELPF